MATYKWETPYDWFTSYVNSRADDAQALRSLLLNVVAQKLDSDDIQDIFQPDMDADGYFATEDEADAQEECNEDCAVHARDCDGYCDHLTDGPRHVNACEGRIGLDGGKRIGEEDTGSAEIACAQCDDRLRPEDVQSHFERRHPALAPRIKEVRYRNV